MDEQGRVSRKLYTSANLLESCAQFGYTPEAAEQYIHNTKATISQC